jgi:dihydrofolate reductase
MIRIIVAMSNNQVIGKDNKLIWRQSNDLKRFKELTSGYACLMGRKTYDSIGRPLHNRKNCIISRKLTELDGCYTYTSIEDAIGDNPDCFIIGGSEIYKQTIDIANEIYLTLIDCDVEGDSHFPEITGFDILSEESFKKDDNNQYDYKFIKYGRSERSKE